MKPRDKAELGQRLKRIAGQVNGIQRMLEGDRALGDVITQISAARAALKSVSSIVLASHVEDRAGEVLVSQTEQVRRELIGELVRLFEKRDA